MKYNDVRRITSGAMSIQQEYRVKVKDQLFKCGSGEHVDSSGRGFVAERPNLRGCRDRGPEDIWDAESGLASLI